MVVCTSALDILNVSRVLGLPRRNTTERKLRGTTGVSLLAARRASSSSFSHWQVSPHRHLAITTSALFSRNNGAASKNGALFSADDLKTDNNEQAKAASSTVEVPVGEVRELALRACRSCGYTEQEAAVLVDVMMYAEMRANSQGLIKVVSGGLNRAPGHGSPKVVKETKLSALIDGNQEMGMLVLSQACEMATAKALEHGVGIVGTNNTCTSTGAIGYYAEKVAAERGLVGIVLAQSPEFVAPHGAKEAVFGTNPFAIAVPRESGERPVVLDMATSAYAYFGLLAAQKAGTELPPDVALDSEGRPTRDPTAALAGAIQVFDRSYKGSNLALMVELLSGSLVGAAVQDKLASKSWGNLVVVVDPALLGSPGEFRQRVEQVLQRVTQAAKVPGVDRIYLPGERGNDLADAREAKNSVPVEVNLLAGLKELAAKFSTATAQGPSSSSSGGYSIATQLVHPSPTLEDKYMATNVPIYQTATFGQPGATSYGQYDYTRSGNPTRFALESQMAELEGADRAFAFASGMAALAAVTRLVANGERIVAGDDIYGGTSRLLAQVVPKQGIEVVNVDTNDLAAMEAAITDNTKLVMLESPTNPRMQITDIASISKMAHAKGAIVVVDNSIMAPVFQRPLDLGADISMTSATKFICGHSDVTGGILSVKDPELANQVYFIQNAEGGSLGPFDCWLCIRGLKTMSLRMEKQQETTRKIADFLSQHPLVKKVNYAGYPGTAGAELHWKQASGSGSLLSFVTGDVNVSQTIVEETKLFKITVSFGNVGSQISLPCFMSHAAIPAEVRAARGLPDDLVRISTGVEDADDLIADLQQAMDKATLQSQTAAVNVSEREKELEARIKELESQLGK